MQCTQCHNSYNRISRRPVLSSKDNVTICEICLLKRHPTNLSVLPKSPLKLQNIVTIPSTAIAILLSIAILCYLHLKTPLSLMDLSNYRVFFILSCTFFMTHQFIIHYRYVSQVRQPVEPQYMFVTLVRQVLFFNQSIAITCFFLLFYLYNLYHHAYGYGSIFVLSSILFGFIIGDTPIKLIVLVMVELVNRIHNIFYRNRISRAITVTTLYVGLVMLSFIGYYHEIELMSLLDLPLFKYTPLRYLKQFRGVSICCYQTVCLVLLMLSGKYRILDILINLFVMVKLLVMPIVLLVEYGVSHEIGINHDMKIEVCAIVSCLLTPLAISLSRLYGKIHW